VTSLKMEIIDVQLWRLRLVFDESDVEVVSLGGIKSSFLSLALSL